MPPSVLSAACFYCEKVAVNSTVDIRGYWWRLEFFFIKSKGFIFKGNFSVL